jgi:hypothetical protein
MAELSEQTKKIQERIEEMKGEEEPRIKREYCPIMSRRTGDDYVACLRDKCAMWSNYYSMCGLIRPV